MRTSIISAVEVGSRRQSFLPVSRGKQMMIVRAVDRGSKRSKIDGAPGHGGALKV